MRARAALALLLCGAAAHASSRPLPFTYTFETAPKGGIELEQFVDATPVLALDFTGARTWQPKFKLVTEFEYGITDRLELGLYLQLSTEPGSGSGISPLFFDGVKERLRFRLADPGDWPIDVGLYLELAELRNEIEIEFKVILQRQLGPIRLVANLWAETEFYFDGEVEFVLNPTFGVTWQVHPAFHLGLEYWMRAEFPTVPPPGPTPFNVAPHHFVGPTVMVQFSRLMWSTGAYLRLDGFDRAAQEGDQFGRVWFRTIIGVDL